MYNIYLILYFTKAAHETHMLTAIITTAIFNN